MAKRKKRTKRVQCSVCGLYRGRRHFRALNDPALVCNQCHHQNDLAQRGQWRLLQENQTVLIDSSLVLDPVSHQRCPSCRVITYRDGGCFHLTCLLCGRDWFWTETEVQENNNIPRGTFDFILSLGLLLSLFLLCCHLDFS